MSRRRTPYAAPPSMYRKNIVPPEDYLRVLEVSFDEDSDNLDNASDVDESEVIEHSDHESDSEIEGNVSKHPHFPSSNDVFPINDDFSDIENDMSDELTIDEKLEHFRRRCSFIQFISNKPAKYGLKIFAVVDSRKFYTLKLEIYCGNQPPGPYEASNSSIDIVKRLIGAHEGSNCNLTTDNWYTSYPLAQYLLTKGISLVGTLRKNKKEIPNEFQPSKTREVGSSLFGFQKDMTIVSYATKKNKCVILLSTLHDDDKIDQETNKSQIILDYNKCKGGVDTVD
ncbi:uncharacterized protein LOC118182410 [Stegodyphus dumicola]|uniref:uncharacterized protein LOC118182410 n=1 Tax=Stegodyphus dumicola TaxID=202533 RepID=UPI0015ABC042|nr:uncharacterized protein LOC118182410 [Stegodyphus dumicola]